MLHFTHRIRPWRFTVVLCVLFFFFVTLALGGYRSVLAFGNVLSEEQHHIAVEHHAAELGLSTYEYEMQRRAEWQEMLTQRAFECAAEPSQRNDCDLWLPSTGTFALGYDGSEYWPAVARAIPSLSPLFRDIIISVLISWSLVWLLPFVFKGIWQWVVVDKEAE